MSTTPNPKEEVASQISALRSQLSSLEQNARLTKIRDEVEDLQTSVSGLAHKIAGLRSRGYVFGRDFEAQAAQFAKQWAQMSANVLTQINQQANRLQTALTPLTTRSAQLAGTAGNLAQARMVLSQLKPQADTLESQVNAAEGQLRGMYDSFQGQVGSLSGQVQKIDWTLAQLAEATFQLLATEAGVMAVKAVLVRDGKEDKEDPDGVLFLTDQRLLFEQKEEVATKKILFITTESQKVQKLLFEAPVALVEEIEASRKGMFKNEDNLEVKFAPSAPTPKVNVHIWQNCDEWKALVNRVKSKDIEKERAVAVDAAAEARVKSAPSQCPSCGGNISQVILRGQDNIKCEYCGFVIRL
jgi:prefoldin subunit 5